MRPTTIIAKDPQTSETLSIAGGKYSLLVTGAETEGAFALIEMFVPTGSGPAPHAHAGFYEAYYVVEGELVFRSETQTYTARKGAFVGIPKGGAIHNFKNESAEPAKLLCIVAAAGLEDVFRQIGTPVEGGEPIPPPPATPERAALLKEVAEMHGLEFFPSNYFEQQRQ